MPISFDCDSVGPSLVVDFLEGDHFGFLGPNWPTEYG